MTAEDILAIVVSYNGRDAIRRSVAALRPQVGQVHIVDNGSSQESLTVLDTLEGDQAVTIERLGVNRGVGYALNIGVRRAREGNYSWLLTMDQDSEVDASMIRAYCDAIDRDPAAVVLAPTISSMRPATGSSAIDYAITSGTLVRVNLFDRIGPYDEGFFVDYIDFDFSLRVRRAGLSLYRVAGALMRHRLGEAPESGANTRFYAMHSPTRRYYMSRNYLYMVERYAKGFPAFLVKLTVSQILLTVFIAFRDPRPLDSYRAMARGVRDYFARKSGPYVDVVR